MLMQLREELEARQSTEVAQDLNEHGTPRIASEWHVLSRGVFEDEISERCHGVWFRSPQVRYRRQTAGTEP